MHHKDSEAKHKSRGQRESQAQNVQAIYIDRISRHSCTGPHLSQDLTEDSTGRSPITAAINTYGMKDYKVSALASAGQMDVLHGALLSAYNVANEVSCTGTWCSAFIALMQQIALVQMTVPASC